MDVFLIKMYGTELEKVMYELFKSQLRSIITTKSYKFTMLIIFGCIICVYIMNIRDYYGYELSQMQSYVEISSISSGRYTLTRIISVVFPFISIIPAGFSLFGDIKTRREIYWIYRVGKRRYYITKALAVLIGTFACFFIPLLFENIINFITFPVSAHGNRWYYSMYSKDFKIVANYFLFDIYFNYPFIYQLIMSLLFSGIAAMFGFITAAASCIINRYMAFLFLPCYLLVQIIDWMNIYGRFSDFIETCGIGVNGRKLFNFSITWGCVMLVACALFYKNIRKDTL